MAKTLISNRKQQARMSGEQLSKHKEYTLKVLNTIERLFKENNDGRLSEAYKLIDTYNYDIRKDEYVKRIII